MPRFELQDTVALKADRSLVGVVDRTSYLESEPLEDCLIINHTLVPIEVLKDFVNTYVPPKGYIFVQFAKQEQGGALVSEDDVVLIDRSLTLGDVVKCEGSQLTGSVINLTALYTLQPIWTSNFIGDFAAQPSDESTTTHICSSTCPHYNPSLRCPRMDQLLYNIPLEELRRAQDFCDGDYITQEEWIGTIDRVDLSVVILLEDQSVVVVRDFEELHIPIPDLGKPLVSLPEFDGIARPEFVVAQQGWSATIPPEELLCGQLVITNHKNIQQGRWLKGSFNPRIRPQGRVLMVRTRRLDVRWLVCNPFIPAKAEEVRRPDVFTLPYENLSTYSTPTGIRRNKKLNIYDPSRFQGAISDRRRPASWTSSSIDNQSPLMQRINSGTTFVVGDRVKFRDTSGAAVKYQGIQHDGSLHGAFTRILPQDVFGFDLNEFQIVHSRQIARVRWQDGSITNHLSTSLTLFNLFESDLSPSDIVVAREGMKQRSNVADGPAGSNHMLSDFNEMTFFEKPHDLLPEKVGIVQKINPIERVAQVRWFLNPRIRIASSGNALGGESRFGPLSDFVEDVSLYEVMTFSGLSRRHRDVVLVPPSSPSTKALEVFQNLLIQRRGANADAMHLSHVDGLNSEELVRWLQSVAAAITLSNAGDYSEIISAVDPSQYKPHQCLDWVAEIVKIGIDGVVTVRAIFGDSCRDVMLEHDQLICTIDEVIYSSSDSGDESMQMETWGASECESDYSGTPETIAESVEYEGGERLDTDSGDENWESEDEFISDVDTQVYGDEQPQQQPLPSDGGLSAVVQDMQDSGQLKSRSRKADSPVKTKPISPNRSRRLLHPVSEEPPAFDILHIDPPSDQFHRASTIFNNSPVFVKRIMKEHRILASSLPEHEIYVRTYENRLDLLRCLIVGPADTPYEHAPFLFDLHLGPNFPREPPSAHFHSWTSGLGRINPNLYEEGHICLSLLGTWPGKSDSESWSEKATILQLLVSLQGLVFVKAPFYNEAGFDGYAEEGQYIRESLLYSEKAFVMARNFVKHALTNPIVGMEDVLAWLYLPHTNSQGLLNTVITRSKQLMESCNTTMISRDNDLVDGTGSRDDVTKIFMKPLSKGALVMLEKTSKTLQAVLHFEEQQRPCPDTDMDDIS